MGFPVITVEGLSKKFTITHEGAHRYTALRDVFARKVKNVLTYSGSQRTSEEFWALDDINFTISQGDRVAIVGRNGAGKSTLLKILSRISEPTKGVVKIKGRVSSLLEVGTGFHPELTGRENIFLNGAILGMKRAEIVRKFDEIVDFAEVEKFLDTPVKRYSSGMYVRLAFAVAAHLEPEILIIDEVLAVGDVNFQNKCLGKMDDVSKHDGRTVIFVSHNMGAVLQLCSKGILLSKGRVEKVGEAAAIVEKYYSSQNNLVELSPKEHSEVSFVSFFTCDSSGEPKNTFGHKEDVRIRVRVKINKIASYHNMGICLLRQDKKRVFTVNKLISELNPGNSGMIDVEFVINGGLIAPMDYSFLLALNSLADSTNYDWQEDVCPIKIYNDGIAGYAHPEGVDFGTIIVRDQWINLGEELRVRSKE